MPRKKHPGDRPPRVFSQRALQVDRLERDDRELVAERRDLEEVAHADGARRESTPRTPVTLCTATSAPERSSITCVIQLPSRGRVLEVVVLHERAARSSRPATSMTSATERS